MAETSISNNPNGLIRTRTGPEARKITFADNTVFVERNDTRHKAFMYRKKNFKFSRAAITLQRVWRRFRKNCLMELLRRYPTADSVPAAPNGYLYLKEPLMWTHVGSLLCPYTARGETCPMDTCDKKSTYLQHRDFPESAPYGLCVFSHAPVEPIVPLGDIHPDMCSYFNCTGITRCNAQHDMICGACGRKSKLAESANSSRSYVNMDNHREVEDTFVRTEWSVDKIMEKIRINVQEYIKTNGSHLHWSQKDVDSIHELVLNVMMTWDAKVKVFKDKFKNWTEEQKHLFGKKNMKMKTRRPRDDILVAAAALITKWHQTPEIYGHITSAEVVVKFINPSVDIASVLDRMNRDDLFRMGCIDPAIHIQVADKYIFADTEENQEEEEIPFKMKVTGNVVGNVVSGPKTGCFHVDDTQFVFIPKHSEENMNKMANLMFLKQLSEKVVQKISTMDESEEVAALRVYHTEIRMKIKTLELQIEDHASEEEIVFEHDGVYTYIVIKANCGIVQHAYATYLPKIFRLATGNTEIKKPKWFTNFKGDVFEVGTAESSVLPLCKKLEEVVVTMEDDTEQKAWIVNDENVVHRHGSQILLFRDANGRMMFGASPPPTDQLCTFYRAVERKDAFIADIKNIVQHRSVLGPMFSTFMPENYYASLIDKDKIDKEIEHFLKTAVMVFLDTGHKTGINSSIRVRCGMSKLNRTLFGRGKKTQAQKFRKKFIQMCDRSWMKEMWRVGDVVEKASHRIRIDEVWSVQYIVRRLDDIENGLVAASGAKKKEILEKAKQVRCDGRCKYERSGSPCPFHHLGSPVDSNIGIVKECTVIQSEESGTESGLPWTSVEDFCMKYATLCCSERLKSDVSSIVDVLIGYVGRAQLQENCSRYYNIFFELCEGRHIPSEFADFVATMNLKHDDWKHVDENMHKFKFCREVLPVFFTKKYRGNTLSNADIKTMFKMTYRATTPKAPQKATYQPREPHTVKKKRKVHTIRYRISDPPRKRKYNDVMELQNMVDDPTLTRVKNECKMCGHGEEVQRQHSKTLRVHGCCRACKHVRTIHCTE